jgi:hypothetical protein
MKTIKELLIGFTGTEEEALTFVQNETVIQHSLIENPTMLALLHQTRLMLPMKAIAANTNSPFQADADVFIEGIRSNSVFNFMQGHPIGDGQIGIIQSMIDANLLVGLFGDITNQLRALRDAAIAICNRPTQPFANAVLSDVKEVLHPSAWQQVTVPDNDKVVLQEDNIIVGASNRGGFRFTIDPSEAFHGKVTIRVKAKDAESTEYAYIDQFTQEIERDFETGIQHAHVLQRSAALAGYKHFIFEYLEPFENALTSIRVEALA